MALPPLNLVPTTKLDAVNGLLLSIGQAPVNSLEVPGVKDVSIATMVLHDVSRAVQATGYWFNTDHDYSLMPELNGDVKLPANALQVTPVDRNLTERDGKLYNTTTHSFKFPVGTPVKVNIKWFFDYHTLPQVAREYIQRRAGRVFQVNIVGSQILYQFTKEMEMEAMAEMQRNNLRVSRPNFIDSATRANRIYSRR